MRLADERMDPRRTPREGLSTAFRGSPPLQEQGRNSPVKNRTPVPREERPPLPDFAPVPRKVQRHDGWTPARQKAFIEALADTGSVSRAGAMVNMTPESAYYLRRQKGAESFRRAWEAALDFGVARMKDIAFERAIEGYLVPMLVGGKLIGWRRKYNDRLLMFCLRHYGEDGSGKRTRIEYFSTRAQAGAAVREEEEDGSMTGSALSAKQCRMPVIKSGMTTGALAEASATTVRTVISGAGEAPDLDATSAVLLDFEGVALDDEAKAGIAAVLRDCAARRREVAGTADDESEPFIAAEQPLREMLVHDPGYKHPRKAMRRPAPAHDVVAAPEEMVEQHPQLLIPPDERYRSGDGEFGWEMLDDEEGMAAVEQAVASVKRAKRGR